MTRLTLTFDNGPDPEVTPRVLDVLRERRVAAWFFVLGKHMATDEGRWLAARAVAEGHLIGNHSYTHAVPLGEDDREDAAEAEIAATEGLIEALLEQVVPRRDGAAAPPRWFRPFGGGGVLGPHLLSERAVAHLIAHRYTCVLWSSVPRDWEDAEGWPGRALAECAAQEHAVLVLHDVANACAPRLAAFLDEVTRRGIELTTELPRSCTPIVEGRVVGDLSGLVAR